MLSIVRVLRVAVALILVALAVLMPGAGAQAHAALREINPADGARLDAPPSAVRLTFTEDVLQGTARLQLTGPAGQIETPVTSDGPVVAGAVPPDLTPGTYTLLWRVTSADGHPISGRSTFTVLSAAAPSAAPTTEPSSDAVTDSATLSAAGQSPAATIDPLDPASSGAGTGTRVAIALGAILAAAAAVASVVARRRRP